MKDVGNATVQTNPGWLLMCMFSSSTKFNITPPSGFSAASSKRFLCSDKVGQFHIILWHVLFKWGDVSLYVTHNYTNLWQFFISEFSIKNNFAHVKLPLFLLHPYSQWPTPTYSLTLRTITINLILSKNSKKIRVKDKIKNRKTNYFTFTMGSHTHGLLFFFYYYYLKKTLFKFCNEEMTVKLN